MVHGPTARKKSNANDDENATIPAQPVAPDGGWGWMVVFGSFMIHIITDGMTYSFGLFYNQFVNYFNEGKGYTAWIVSILVGVTFASGPISSSFVNRYGCRPVTIAGSILAGISMILSVFAQNVFTLILTIGFGAGLGLGLIYLPAIVSVTTYFDARRSLATGIAVCGSGFGTFLFAPFTEFLIVEYGWRGAMLIIGGIVLNCILFGMLFRPLEAPQPKALPGKEAIIDENTTPAELKPLKSALKANASSANMSSDQYLQLPGDQTAMQHGGGGGSLCRSSSMGGNNNNSLSSKADYSNGHTNAAPVTKQVVKSTSSRDLLRTSMSHPHLAGLNEAQSEKFGSGTMYRPDVLYQGSLLNIPEYARSRTDLEAPGTIKRYGSLRQSTTLSHNQEVEKCCGCFTCSQETRDTLAEMMNMSLLKDVVFILFAVSNFCTSIGFNMPYVYIVLQAETLGLTSKQSSYLIAIIGVANTIGRIILGYISDKPWVNRLWVYNVCLTACGIATMMCPLGKDFFGLAVYCSVFGFTIGAYVGLTSVILVDLLGLDKLTNAFGLLLLFQGVASFIGPPLGGWFYDITHSYSPAFILAGAMIAISGVMLFAIPPVQRHLAKKAIKQQQQHQQMALR